MPEAARRFVALPLAQLVPGVTRAAFARRSPAGAAVMADWVGIVGARLAAVTQPRRLTRGVLTVACAGPVAMELAHLQGALIERINTHAGAGVVTGLRFTQDLVVGRAVEVVGAPVGEVVVERVEGVGEELGGALGGLLAAIRERAVVSRGREDRQRSASSRLCGFLRKEHMMSPPEAVCSPNLPTSQAFLKMLRWLENYPRDDDAVYYATYGNGTFTDGSKHPHKPHTKWGRTSTAAGAYMLIFSTWENARARGVVFDFMPASQDKVAWWLIEQSHAQALVCAGSEKLEQAFAALGSQWASLPGASQSQVSVAQAKARYSLYLGQYSAGAKQVLK